VTLSGNSYGHEACKTIADLLTPAAPKLTTINFNDIFVSRKREELPGSLEMLARAIRDKKIIHLNLSDNAFGPDGIRAFDFLLKEMSTMETLKVNNCGIGPQGGEMIAEALKENKDLKLKNFTAGRDRLENVGITALAEVFKAMKSLEVIEVPQNGIKKAGMLALLESFKENA
jgi:Ran GTPase-activating protein 1